MPRQLVHHHPRETVLFEHREDRVCAAHRRLHAGHELGPRGVLRVREGRFAVGREQQLGDGVHLGARERPVPEHVQRRYQHPELAQAVDGLRVREPGVGVGDLGRFVHQVVEDLGKRERAGGGGNGETT